MCCAKPVTEIGLRASLRREVEVVFTFEDHGSHRSCCRAPPLLF
jgi:hypothetical protein